METFKRRKSKYSLGGKKGVKYSWEGEEEKYSCHGDRGVIEREGRGIKDRKW